MSHRPELGLLFPALAFLNHLELHIVRSGFRYSDENDKSIHYCYLINGPHGNVFLVEFDGKESVFTPELRAQMQEIMNSWVFDK